MSSTCMCSNPECQRNGCLNERQQRQSYAGRAQFYPYVGQRQAVPMPQSFPICAKGWECPRCSAIHAPHIDQCNCGNSDKGERA